jgi:hypothetical protein
MLIVLKDPVEQEPWSSNEITFSVSCEIKVSFFDSPSTLSHSNGYGNNSMKSTKRYLHKYKNISLMAKVPYPLPLNSFSIEIRSRYATLPKTVVV